MARDFDWGALWVCFLIMAVVHNIAESSFVGLTGSMTSVILFLSVSFAAATSYTREVSGNL